ncbi:MAG: hypothetical protein ACR2P1_15545 [Pseudomonadales bacterium]
MSLSDNVFLHQFEEMTLPAEEFTHRGHLRLAWLYLNRYGLQVAIEKTTNGIRAYAASMGATDKFHHTLTEAIVRIMFSRLQRNRTKNFDTYLLTNQDLVENISDVVHSHYSENHLNSTTAKRGFVAPDVKDFC